MSQSLHILHQFPPHGMVHVEQTTWHKTPAILSTSIHFMCMIYMQPPFGMTYTSPLLVWYTPAPFWYDYTPALFQYDYTPALLWYDYTPSPFWYDYTLALFWCNIHQGPLDSTYDWHICISQIKPLSYWTISCDMFVVTQVSTLVIVYWWLLW